jgi:hypothetical protein
MMTYGAYAVATDDQVSSILRPVLENEADTS